MSNRTISILGLIISVLGVIVSAITIIFTQYKFISLLSLFVVEGFVVIIWWLYVRQKNKVLYPHDYESKFRAMKYVFESPNKMTCEVIEVFKITRPYMPRKPIKLFWSGRGQLTLETPLLSQEIKPAVDGLTGEIRFDYPLFPASKFGDVAVVAYKLNLEDATAENKPELYAQVNNPTDLLVMEVILRYKQDAQPAWFGSRRIEGDPSAFLAYEKIDDIPFDTNLKAFRRVISKPFLHHKYQIKWEK